MPIFSRKHFIELLCICILALGLVERVRSDFVIYRFPGTKSGTILEGKTRILAGRLLEYTHPTFGTIALDLDDALIVRAPTRQEEYKRLFIKASKSKDIEDYL